MTKKVFFEEVYLFDDPENLSDNQWDNLLIFGRMNMDPYFLPFKTRHPHEVLRKVELLEFDKEKEMFKNIKKTESNQLINYSLDHEKPCLLKFRS